MGQSTTTTTTKPAVTDQSNDSEQKNAPTKGANESVTDTTTVTAAAATQQQVEKRGEVVIDDSLDAHTLKEQSGEERLDDARNEALANHNKAKESEKESGTNHGDPTSRDKEA